MCLKGPVMGLKGSDRSLKGSKRVRDGSKGTWIRSFVKVSALALPRTLKFPVCNMLIWISHSFQVRWANSTHQNPYRWKEVQMCLLCQSLFKIRPFEQTSENSHERQVWNEATKEKQSSRQERRQREYRCQFSSRLNFQCSSWQSSSVTCSRVIFGYAYRCCSVLSVLTSKWVCAKLPPSYAVSPLFFDQCKSSTSSRWLKFKNCYENKCLCIEWFFFKIVLFTHKIVSKLLATLFFWITTKSYKRKLQKAKTVKVLLLIYDLSKPIIRTFWKQEWEKSRVPFFCAERVFLAPCAQSIFSEYRVFKIEMSF